MKFLYSSDPIIACSTCSHANAAMAVIRISGFASIAQFSPFFKKDLRGPIEPRKVYYTQLVLQGQVVDDLCFTYFESPKSYNGENVLELSVHGNTLNIERILDLFTKHGGCRLAAPGEFTYRALKNKKLTLSQVEGLDLFLNANSGYALDQGLSLLNGNLHELYQEIYDLFLIHKSSLELLIDFSDDIGEEAAKEYFHKSLQNFSNKLTQLHKRVLPLDQNLISPEIVLAGLPNSGKSSLFNFLLGNERAIVSSKAGTTRDYLSEILVIENVKYKLIDTAGIRVSDDFIESEGIKRTLKKLRESFFSVLLINPFEMDDEFSEIVSNSFDLVVFTHKDLPGFDKEKEKLTSNYPFLGPMGAIDLSQNPVHWEQEFHKEVNKKYLKTTESNPILLDRHKEFISQAMIITNNYKGLCANETDVAILSQELNNLGHCVSELVGIVSPDEILNSIFTNFCIGK